MTCDSILPYDRVSSNKRIRSRDGHVDYIPELVFSPASVKEIQDIVRCAERQRPARRVHACGSRWSLNDNHKASDFLIVPDELRQILSISTQAEQNETSYPLKSDVFSNVFGLIHTQSGATFQSLYELATKHDGAIPTQGGGAGGTTIAGVTSTSTHGSDVDMGPLADYIRAIHLIGSGGREYWIEPSEPNNISAPQSWDDSPLNTADFEVIYDDNVFNAARVSLGRFGVIYSLVYEIIPAYYMLERREPMSWPIMRDQFIRGNSAQHLLNKFHWSNEGLNNLPRLYPATEPRFFQVDISLGTYSNTSQGPSVCYATRRCVTEPESPVVPKDKFVLQKGNEGELIENFFADLHNALLMAELGLQNPSEVINLIHDEDRLANLLNGVGNATRRRLVELIVKESLEQHPNRYAMGPNSYIDGGLITTTELPAGDSVEYMFDANDTDRYTEFVDFALDSAKFPHQIVGWISLRYTRQADALIGMQQFERTVAVEISFLKGIVGNGAYLRVIQEKAIELSGIPHWGQMHQFSNRREIEGHYGKNLTTWLKALSRLSRYGNASTFENEFSNRIGLRPLRADNLLLFTS